MFHASCLDYFCQGNLIGLEHATAEGGLVHPEASCIILTDPDGRQAVENRCTPQ